MSDTANIFEQKPDLDTFGGRLQRARDAAGISVRDLAWRLGVKTATVEGWECDRALPSSHRMATLAGMLNVSLSWLLHGVGTGTTEEHGPPMPAAVDEQLAKLQLLHAETGQLIGRIQSDMERLKSPPAA